MWEKHKKEMGLWSVCILLTVTTGVIRSVWTVFLLKRIVEVVLEQGIYAPYLLFIFLLSVWAEALLGILLQKLRYRLYQKRAVRMEDGLICACGRQGGGGKEAFVLIQNTVNDLAANRTDWVLDCSRIVGVSLILGIYTCSISIEALILCLVITVAALFLMRRSSRRIPDAAQSWNEKMNAVYGEMWNYLRCKEILPFLQPKVYGRFEGKVRENQREQILLGKYTNTARICMRFGSVGITLAAVVYFGALTIKGLYTLPELLAVTMLLPNLADSMLQIPDCIARHKKLKGIEGNVAAFLESHAKEEDAGKEAFGGRITSIQASDIRYGYKEGECHCRTNGFLAGEGSVTGVFGESGSGKTTLLKIILGELQGGGGECRINGRRVESIKRSELWSHILYLSQDSVILPVGLRENITLTGERDPAKEERYRDALRKAGIEELEAAKGEGELDLSTLSSGEVQKVCLARCFYTDKEVIILDEAASAMSPGAKKAVLHNLVRDIVREKKILILVSHDPEVVGLCDKTVWIERDGNGGIPWEK